MNQVFRYTGYSKQAFHQQMNRRLLDQQQQVLLLPIITELRLEHPGVSARQLYLILQPENMGRDKFEAFCFDNGFKLHRSKAYRRTTDSSGVIRFPNLVIGRELTGINQAWSSDITYYQLGIKFYYLTFILDLFSRKLIGWSVSNRLLTEQTTIPALEMAVAERRPQPGVIFHSDGGGQYYCKAFLKLTQRHKIKNSMCDIVYENAHAERINGTIKNQYIKGYKPKNFEQLVEMTKRAVKNYNQIRPHASLSNLPPVTFENQMPAGGTSLTEHDFCIVKNKGQHHQKNHVPSMKEPLTAKPVEKTVNVI